jgi:tetratricopeptide (TPR) repeat protein
MLTTQQDQLASAISAASSLSHQGQLDEAEAVLLSATALFPNEFGPWHDLARLAERLGHWSDAERRWRRCLTLDDRQWWAHTSLGVALREQGRADEAVAVLVGAAARFPHEAAPWQELARLAAILAHWSEAEACWRRSIALDDRHWWAHTSLAVALREQGRADEAKAVLLAATARFPEEAGPWHDLARLADRAAHWSEAEASWRRAIALDDRAWWLHTSLAATLREQGRTDEAVAVLTAAAARFPDETAPWHDLARLAENAGNWPEAEACWRGCLARDNRQWWIHAGLVAALREQGRKDEAELLLLEATVRFPDEAGPWHDLAKLAESVGHWSEAEACWRRCLARDDRHWVIHASLAAALRQQRRADESEAVLLAATLRFPDESGPWHELAMLAEGLGHWSDAEARWRRALALGDPHFWAHASLAGVLRMLGRTDELEAVLVAATDRFPHETGVWHDRARLAESAGRWSEAEACWRRSLTLNDRQWPAHTALAAALREQGRLDEAEAVLLDAMGRFPNEAGPAAEHALIAEVRFDWVTALSRWRLVRARFPSHSAGPARMAHLLRRLGRLDEAEAVIGTALLDLPMTVELADQFALNAIERKNWLPAFPRLASAAESFPDSKPVRRALYQARLRILESEPALLAAGALSEISRKSAPAQLTARPAEIAASFESLGGGVVEEGGWAYGCEFGAFQQAAGVEPIGLLRWASIAPTSLAAALEDRFAGIDSPGEVTVHDHGGYDWGYSHTRYKILVNHTNLEVASVSRAEVHRRVCRLLGFLSRKLIADLESDEKFFVYRMIGHEIDGDVLDRLAQAVSSYGQNRFMFVRRTSDTNKHFTVEERQPGFFIGHIDRFSTEADGDPFNHNDQGWEKLCRAALMLPSGGKRRPYSIVP